MSNDSKVLLTIRKLIKIGNAQGISLPKDWISVNNIKEGDKLLIRIETIKYSKKKGGTTRK